MLVELILATCKPACLENVLLQLFHGHGHVHAYAF